MTIRQPSTASSTVVPLAPPDHAGRDLLIWGAHGGAGVSTLAALLRPARDMGVLHPESAYRHSILNQDTKPVLIACRCTTWSALKASAAVSALTKVGGTVDVLAVVSDGWPEPPIATAWFRLLSAQVGVVARVPFVPWLRVCNDPSLAKLPRAARHALSVIRQVADRPLFTGGLDAAVARDA